MDEADRTNRRPRAVAFHLDHCTDLDVIKGCIEHGWTDVMIDASALPYEDNLSLTMEAVALASASGLGVEAELGRIVGVEGRYYCQR